MKIQDLRDGSIRNIHEIGGGGPMLPMPVDGSGHGSWPAWGGDGGGGQDDGGGGDGDGGGRDGSIPPDVPTVWDDTNTFPVQGDGPPWHLWLLAIWALWGGGQG